jgi:hypothetical protein
MTVYLSRGARHCQFVNTVYRVCFFRSREKLRPNSPRVSPKTNNWRYSELYILFLMI